MLDVLYQSWHSRSSHIGIDLATFFFDHHSCQHLHTYFQMLFIYLFICLFSDLLINLFICLFVYSFINLVIHFFICSFAIYSFIHYFWYMLNMSARLVGTLNFDIQAFLNAYIGFWQQFTLKMTSEAISEHKFFPRRHASKPPSVVYVLLMLPHTDT